MKHNVKDYINKEFLDEDGFYMINVNLYKGFSLYNELSFDKQKELNDEIFNYIDTKSEVIPNEYKLKIKFNGRKLDEEDKKRIEYLIHEHYYVVMENVKRELDKLTYKMVLLLLLGLVGFTLYYIFAYRIAFNSLILEFLGLVGSFSIWESIGLFVFDRKDILDKPAAELLGLEVKSMGEILTDEECVVAPAVGTAVMMEKYLN